MMVVPVIAAVHGLAETRGARGVAGDRVEVDDAVELAGGADPAIHGLAAV